MQENKGAGGCGPAKKRHEVGLIMRANRLHHSAVEKRLKALGMHRSQHMLLMSVSHSPDNVSQKELAERLQITPAAVAMTLKKLESSGYISRRADTDDNRVNRITVSEKGEEAVKLSEEIFSAVDDAMFEGISESELTAFIQIMEKINNNLLALGADDYRRDSKR